MNGSLPYKKNIEEKTRWSGQPFRTSLSCVYCCFLSLNLSSSLSLSLVSVSFSLSFLSLFIHLSCSLFWVRTLRCILSLRASVYRSLYVVFHTIKYICAHTIAAHLLLYIISMPLLNNLALCMLYPWTEKNNITYLRISKILREQLFFVGVRWS